LTKYNLVRGAARLVAGAILIVWLAVPATAQMSDGTSVETLAQQAEDRVAQRQYSEALDLYLALLDRSTDPDTSLQFAIRAAQLGNATGRSKEGYEALKPRLADVSNLDPQLADKAQEVLIEAADGLKLKDETLSAARRLLAYRRTTQGASSVAAQAAQLTLSNLLEKYDLPDEGRTMRTEALNALSKGDASLYQSILNNTAIALQNGGSLDSAAEIFERLIASLKGEPDSVELGITHFNAALLDRERGDFDAAIGHHLLAIGILERLSGHNSPDTIAAVGGLGQTYSFAGRPAAAVPPLRDALARAEEGLGDTDDTMIQANNLADVLRTLDKFDEAEALDRRAYEWRLSNLGEAQQSTLISKKNLALDLIGLRRAEEAAGLMAELVAALEQTLGHDNPQTIAMRRQSEIVAILTGQSPASSTAFDELMVGTQATADNVRMANLLAGIADKSGDRPRELKLNALALELSRKVYGPLHPMTIAMLTNAARTARQQMQPDAIERYVELEKVLRLWSQREIASSADPAIVEDVARKTRETIGDMLSFAMQVSPKNTAGAELFSSILLDWKAVSSLERDVVQTAERQATDEDKKLIAEVRDLRRKSLEAGGQPQVTTELDAAEARLADRLSPFRALQAESARSYRDILATLAPGEAVLDYIIVPLRVSPEKVEERILAMLGRGDQNVLFYDLGPAAKTDALVPEPEALAKPATRKALYRILIAPVMKRLDDVSRLHVVPDGILNIVPFDGLIDAAGKNLIETVDVRVARNGRSVNGSKTTADVSKPGNLLLVGDVDYGGNASPLPFTGAEIDAIARLAPAAGLLAQEKRGLAASEAEIRGDVAGSRIVHFATHGFFQPADGEKSSPLWRSGILLAAAKTSNGNTAGPQTDGIVHAAEIANWPLSGSTL
jgi:CHAT domain-containing protein